MNVNGEDLGELGGLGDMMPAEVLKKLNEVLERLHQADHHHGGNIINIYASGSQHVDRVEKQYIVASPPNPLPREGGEMREERGRGDIYNRQLITQKIYHYFGDPSMMIYTTNPQDFMEPIIRYVNGRICV